MVSGVTRLPQVLEVAGSNPTRCGSDFLFLLVEPPAINSSGLLVMAANFLVYIVAHFTDASGNLPQRLAQGFCCVYED